MALNIMQQFGVREICDVVFRAKGTIKFGDRVFYKDEPVIYFDTLKTSGLEQATTQAYAQGGKGNARLVSWDGEKTVTFTMEDALISPAGLAILASANLLSKDAEDTDNPTPAYVHTTARYEIIAGTTAQEGKFAWYGASSTGKFYCPYTPAAIKTDTYGRYSVVYGTLLDADGVTAKEPILFVVTSAPVNGVWSIELAPRDPNAASGSYILDADYGLAAGKTILLDFYTKKSASIIRIPADTTSQNFYVEASTLFRDRNGVDHAAELVIPNCKPQSGFTFNMSSTGDPSTFTFTCDAFPDYPKYDPTEKVFVDIQILDGETETEAYGLYRTSTIATTSNS